MSASNPDRLVGEEARKAHPARASNGFIEKYLSGSAIIDVGYRGYRTDTVPIVENAVGVDLDYPGYDGITLPMEDESRDAVFASHCLEHIEDFRNSIRDWFRVLKIGGYLIIMVPHKFLYEKQTDLPSRYNGDHKRFYTPASLMNEIETSLRPNTYRLRHLIDNDSGYDYSIPPGRHSGGSYEIELVIEKIKPPAWRLARPPVPGVEDNQPLGQRPAAAEMSPVKPDRIVGPIHGGNPSVRIIATDDGDVAMFDFGARPVPRPRILVLKLDHLGDFIIAQPSLRRLREAFPAARIHMIVGSWNRAEAEASDLVDEVGVYDYFPRNSVEWDGTPHERVDKFRALCTGRYDIAIDLRVDDDTRFLLAEVDAALRCGIGSLSRHPFLDVVLPPEHIVRDNTAAPELTPRFIEPDRFNSLMPFRHPFFHETDFRPIGGHLVYGPGVTLPLGHFKAIFDLQFTGWNPGMNKTRVTLDIARDGSEIIALRRLRTRQIKRRDGIELCFENNNTAARYEFRVHVAGKPWRGMLRFAGVRLEHREAVEPARFRPAALHIGEQLSLLVQLVSDRARILYDEAASPLPGRGAADPAGRVGIAIAPFSNSDLRDWPMAHYARLISLLIERLDCTVTLLGSRPQAGQLERLAREAGDGVPNGRARIRNMGGQTSWSDTADILRAADLVICNNSGVAHLAAASGALTLAIYSASHQPREWGPRGQRSHALMAVVSCSPCGHDRLDDCPNEHRCMRDLSPETVFEEACRLLDTSEDDQLRAIERPAAQVDTAP